MEEMTVTVDHEAGLHARPLAQFVKVVRQFNSEIQVSNLTREKGPVKANSPLQLMLLAVSQGHQIKVQANGTDAKEALEAVKQLIDNNFNE
ncbi:MAG: HPr family phosphocarrier protein [Chloroflexota bacterium]